MSIETGNKINQLLQKSNPGELYFSSWLKENGYSDQLVKKYRDSGWLSSLSKGVMYRTGDKPTLFGALESYNRQLNKNFHIGALSTFELTGRAHYIPMGRATITIIHPKQEVVPDWLKSYDFGYTLEFFSTETLPKPKLMNYKPEYPNAQISSLEQAFFECLLIAPKRYSYMDLYHVMENLSTLRPKVLQELLENTDNLRVKRMFLYMAEKADHQWFEYLDVNTVELGTSKLQLTKSGVYVPKYRITVSKELYGKTV